MALPSWELVCHEHQRRLTMAIDTKDSVFAWSGQLADLAHMVAAHYSTSHHHHHRRQASVITSAGAPRDPDPQPPQEPDWDDWTIQFLTVTIAMVAYRKEFR